jgi:hypothetical protein
MLVQDLYQEIITKQVRNLVYVFFVKEMVLLGMTSGVVTETREKMNESEVL